ncbi:MAG: 3-dehydroquinate synthase [Gammaproteobacteria bacterium]
MNQIMMQIPAQKPISYSIRVGSGLLANPEEWLPSNLHTKRVVIITDDNVNKIYGVKLSNTLNRYQPLLLSFSPGEKSKNYQTKHLLEEQMIQHRCNRDTIILSLGGGVVGDLAGFIASTYMRGISYIQIPTTLLAMVDSSVGGKTGINTQQGKNLIGAFWQPSCVVVDLNCLTTLSQTHIINGLIEALKMFITNDVNFFHYVSDNINSLLNNNIAILKKLVERAIKIKVNIVSDDEKEINQRMILNFGHTIGHALEKITDYTMLHGYAVALGILVEAKISQLLGFLPNEEYQMIQSLFLQLNISGQQLKNMNSDEIIQATKSDKKIKSNHVRYILLKNLGQVYYEDNIFAFPVSDEIVNTALIEVCEV